MKRLAVSGFVQTSNTLNTKPTTFSSLLLRSNQYSKIEILRKSLINLGHARIIQNTFDTLNSLNQSQSQQHPQNSSSTNNRNNIWPSHHSELTNQKYSEYEQNIKPEERFPRISRFPRNIHYKYNGIYQNNIPPSTLGAFHS